MATSPKRAESINLLIQALDAQVDEQYIQWQKVAFLPRREKVFAQFQRLDKKLQTNFPKFFYKQKVLEDMIVVAGNVHHRGTLKNSGTSTPHGAEITATKRLELEKTFSPRVRVNAAFVIEGLVPQLPQSPATAAHGTSGRAGPYLKGQQLHCRPRKVPNGSKGQLDRGEPGVLS